MHMESFIEACLYVCGVMTKTHVLTNTCNVGVCSLFVTIEKGLCSHLATLWAKPIQTAAKGRPEPISGGNHTLALTDWLVCNLYWKFSLLVLEPDRKLSAAYFLNFEFWKKIMIFSNKQRMSKVTN